MEVDVPRVPRRRRPGATSEAPPRERRRAGGDLMLPSEAPPRERRAGGDLMLPAKRRRGSVAPAAT